MRKATALSTHSRQIEDSLLRNAHSGVSIVGNSGENGRVKVLVSCTRNVLFSSHLQVFIGYCTCFSSNKMYKC